MSKTLEEAAREFMQSAPIEAISPYYEEDMIEMFKGGVEYALSLPLASRLTAEEKERVRKEYRRAYSESFSPTSCLDRQYARGRYQVLREIFGPDFFKEGE